MKKTTLLFVILLFTGLMLGCNANQTTAPEQKSTASTQKSAETSAKANAPAATNDAQIEISALKSAPNDYCVIYLNEISGLPPELNTEIEYCVKGTDIMTKSILAGSETKTLCLEGGKKNLVCFGEQCMPNTNPCGAEKAPFASVTTNDLKYYKKASGRQIAGLSTKCYTLNLREIQGMQEISGLGKDYEMIELCYHPELNYLLYYKGGGIKTEVKSFVTPAPADRFKTG